MSHRANTKQLMASLAHLSGLAYDVFGEEVDWFESDLASVTGDTRDISEAGPRAKLAAQRETLKGELAMLAKRMGGVMEMVDEDRHDQAAVSLEKILSDGARILERLGTVKVPKKQPKAPVEPEKGTTQSDRGREPRGPGAPVPDERKELGGSTTKSTGESVYMDGYLITEEDRRDPFGFGQGLIDSVRGALGLRKGPRR